MNEQAVVPEVVEMVPAPMGIVRPAVTPAEAVEAWNEYQALKAAIVTPDDVQNIQGKDFLKKSYWRKIRTFFNLQVEIIKEERIIDERDGVVHFSILYRATDHKTGCFADGDGACSSDEKGLDKTFHNNRATAHTRAFNRAVSNLVGGGEVSAEEVLVNASDNKPSASSAPPPQPPPQPQPAAQSSPTGRPVCPQCGQPAIIKGKEEYGGGWLCWKKEGGCGAKFDHDPSDVSEHHLDPDPEPAEEPLTDYQTALDALSGALTVEAISEVFNDHYGHLKGKAKANFKMAFDKKKVALEKGGGDVPM